MTKYEKLKVSLRYWLLGRGFIIALKAMEFAEKYHTGTRKDNVTPEFEHQIKIGHFVRTLQVVYVEATLAVAFLHDVPEDYDVSITELKKKFGKRIANATWLLTKKHRGMVKDLKTYYREIAKCIIASVVKAADRVHNLQSMQGVFDPEKQQKYVEEVETYILPMLKEARGNFPEQELVYENLKHMLVSQCELIRAINKWEK